jgi:hypothetical protein
MRGFFAALRMTSKRNDKCNDGSRSLRDDKQKNRQQQEQEQQQLQSKYRDPSPSASHRVRMTTFCPVSERTAVLYGGCKYEFGDKKRLEH